MITLEQYRAYERLHVLCYIILSQSPPERSSGKNQMVRSAVDMEESMS